MVRAGKTKKKAKNVTRKPAKKQVKRAVVTKSKKAVKPQVRKKPPLKKASPAKVRSAAPVKLSFKTSSVRKTVLKPAVSPKVKKAVSAPKLKTKPETAKKKSMPAAKKSLQKTAVKPAAPQKMRVKSSAISAGLKRQKALDLLGAVRVSLRKKPKSPPAPVVHEARPAELPQNYGDNMIYFMVRDPCWAYAYWELQRDYVENARARLGGSWEDVCVILRVYDTTEKEGVFHDLYLGGITNHWYVNTQPNRRYFVEIGVLHKDGRFLALAKSNQVLMPRSQMSDVLDEQWMDIDFDKVYALSGGFDPGKSSMEVRKLMEDKIQGNISSGSGAGLLSSMSSPGAKGPPGKDRKFWFWLDCEVIVYGGTEPDAKVTFQGKVIQLRPDGTFSFRFALPDGKFVFDAKAESADGIEERVITPVVQRETYRPEPVIRPAKGS